ncbi:DUF1642 domain-containing protein [Streptococcus suis]
MNKQEAIERIYNASWDCPDYEGLIVEVKTVNNIIYQIDEPQKVVVPKFVAEWIEEHKAQFSNLYTVYSWLGQQKNQVSEWVNSNIDIFARAWIFGYEVEKEQLYTVEIPDPNRSDTATFLYKENGKVFIGTDIFLGEFSNYKWKKDPDNQLTESEIKQDFEWAWQFAKEV